MTTQWNVDDAAAAVAGAETAATVRSSLTAEWPALDTATAYEVQDALVRRKVDSGHTVVGVQLEATSKPAQDDLGTVGPVTGWLTDRMLLPAGEALPSGELIEPRVEPVLAFVLGERITGPGITAPVAMAGVSGVYAGARVVDSRFGGAGRIADVVADNASTARFAVGAVGRGPGELNLELEACLLEFDGEIVNSATGAEVHGNPGEALAYAANTLARRGVTLESGWLVLTGGLTPPVAASPGGTVTAHFTNLGSISVVCG